MKIQNIRNLQSESARALVTPAPSTPRPKRAPQTRPPRPLAPRFGSVGFPVPTSQAMCDAQVRFLALRHAEAIEAGDKSASAYYAAAVRPLLDLRASLK